MLSGELRPVLDRYYRGTDSDAHTRGPGTTDPAAERATLMRLLRRVIGIADGERPG